MALAGRWVWSREATALATMGVLLCFGRCAFDTTGLQAPPHCGDREINAWEQCDRDNMGGLTCASLGRGQGELACTPSCTLDVSGCQVSAGCGNGIPEAGEQCDDGNRDACDGCSAACTVERCGDGVRECDEECDDGNTSNEDDCVEGCRRATCGDGWLQVGVERCDVGVVSSTCEALGLGGGTLGCAADCQSYDTTGCTGTDGAPCEDETQCDGGACLSEAALGWPEGLCSRACDLLTPCPESSVCVNSDAGRFCYPRCLDSTDCRAGYLCALDPWEGSELVCRPRCERDAQCPATGACNIWVGLCGVPVVTGHGETGDPCGTGEPPCKGACWAGQPGGYCVSPCALTTGYCPGDGMCSDVGHGAWGDYGYCLDGCQDAASCPRDGYHCVTNPYSLGSVCLPP